MYHSHLHLERCVLLRKLPWNFCTVSAAARLSAALSERVCPTLVSTQSLRNRTNKNIVIITILIYRRWHHRHIHQIYKGRGEKHHHSNGEGGKAGSTTQKEGTDHHHPNGEREEAVPVKRRKNKAAPPKKGRGRGEKVVPMKGDRLAAAFIPPLGWCCLPLPSLWVVLLSSSSSSDIKGAPECHEMPPMSAHADFKDMSLGKTA